MIGLEIGTRKTLENMLKIEEHNLNKKYFQNERPPESLCVQLSWNIFISITQKNFKTLEDWYIFYTNYINKLKHGTI